MFSDVWEVDEEGLCVICSRVLRPLIMEWQRLALRRTDRSDENKIIQPLLDIMEDHQLDFHGTFRKLSFFRPSLLQPSDPYNTQLDTFVSGILALSPEADHAKATKGLSDWLHIYSERILSERDLWKDEADMDLARENAAKRANPRFVLRQWVLEEVIKNVEKDTGSGKRVLGKILQVSASCFFLYVLMLSPCTFWIDGLQSIRAVGSRRRFTSGL